MKSTRILAVLLGAFLACVIGVAAFVLFFPSQVRILEWRLGLLPPVVEWGDFWGEAAQKPCPPDSRGLIVTRDFRPDPLNEPLVEMELGIHHKTVFARFGDNGFESRSVFFVIEEYAPEGVKEYRVEADARFHTDAGNYVGGIDGNASGVRVEDDELCFDLTIERMDGSKSVERWQGRLSLK